MSDEKNKIDDSMEEVNALNDNETVILVDVMDEMKKSYLDYAMSVIVSRALPDVRDGLKPVHRRILYAMNEINFTYDKQHRKSARIVGEVIGKYHPHGDSSIYNAMVRFAQDFSMRYLLVDGHGNFGSIDGDGAAAMRYTEARMTRLAGDLLKDIEKETVDFRPNFDETEKEPVVLPSRFPNLLVNGSNGIAVGMATSIPPHNLGEIIDGAIKLIEDPEADVFELMELIKGPDFPTGAEIIGIEGIKRAYRTGRGKAVLRSKTEIEEMKNGKSRIVVTEIPYQVNKAKMIEGIAELVKNKRIDGITDLRDESNRNGIRVVIELRRDVNANIILNQLFKNSQLQTTFSIIMLALDHGEPKVMNLKQMLEAYISHQKEVERRRVIFDLRKAKDRAHILEGLRIAIDNIDEVIRIIRSAYNDAEQRLMERFGLSDVQAKSIVDMRLRRLQGLEREKIENEYTELLKTIEYLNSLLEDELKLMEIIKDDLLRIKNQYNDERRSSITFSADEIEYEDMIEEDEVVITLTHAGYIKRVSTGEYASQKRGGRGKTGLSTREEDFVKDIFTTSTHDFLLFFTNFGKVYRLKAYRIPDGSRTSKGTAIVNLLPLEPDESVNAIVPIKNFEEGYLTFCTKHGVIKKTPLEQFDTSRKSGLIAIHLKDEDQLISVRHTYGENDIIVVTRNGKSIRFGEEDVRAMGRTAAGVRAIKLSEWDEVIEMDLITESGKLLVVSENGYGKRTLLSQYRKQTRGGKGIMTYNSSQKTGRLIGAKVVDDGDDLMIINDQGVLIRIKVDEVSVSGRITSGVRVMKVDSETKLVSIAKVHDDGEDEE
ncbi:DNA gyrase subunit A [Fusibacter tunisiensis]|uniref:DNA gyrase subunit A n=2 Tax=Fusibacter tunisiensis TaxID=1008308 RepID=A0ABS2MNP1_9FIRM|nr:DNA gyrase subunit A [Fusibacter tunisiensis]